MRSPSRSSSLVVAGAMLLLEAGCAHVAPAPLPGAVASKLESKRPAAFDQPDAAEAYSAMKRRADDGASRPLYDRYAEARIRMGSMDGYSSATGELINGRAAHGMQGWEWLGPGNIGGRTRTIAVDPRDDRVLYAGGVSGGLWKSSDGGASWSAIGDGLENIAVNSLALDPADPSTIWIGTGEGHFREEVRGTGLPLRGAGIFLSRDGGTSWARLPGTAGEDFQWVNDLVISPTSSDRVYAATRTGVWRSDDAGATWIRSLASSAKGGCLDLALGSDPSHDLLFASCGTLDRGTVYRNQRAEADGAWATVLSEAGMGRTSLAVAPSDPRIVYALSASIVPGPDGIFLGALHALFRSDSGGDAGSWTALVRNTSSSKLATMMLTNPIAAFARECFGETSGYVPMGWYVNVIAVDPVDPQRVWLAGVDLFRSSDGGRTWGAASYWWNDSTGAFMHADQHAIVFHPRFDGGANQTVWFANDGGIYRTDNARAGIGTGTTSICDPNSSSLRFVALNHDLGITQFYHGAVSGDGARIAGGAQDNGTLLRTPDDGPNDWRRIHGGDGGYVAFDPTDDRVVYAESQVGRIVKSTDGGTEFRDAAAGLDDRGFLFITPFVLDPSDPARLWIGGSRLWRSNDGASSWSAASTGLAGSVSAIGVDPRRPERVLAGTNGGAIHRSDAALSANGSTLWQHVSPRAGFVSSIAFDPHDPEAVWATYAGFGGDHVWKSPDGGFSWSPLRSEGNGALPDIPVHSIVVDPSTPGRLYLGTDLGVFSSLDGGAHWYVERSGVPAVVVETLALRRRGDAYELYAFTHGRGVWRVALDPIGRRRAARR